jgi:hypothetical protein
MKEEEKKEEKKEEERTHGVVAGDGALHHVGFVGTVADTLQL